MGCFILHGSARLNRNGGFLKRGYSQIIQVMDDLLSIETYGFKTWHPQIDHLPQQKLPSCHQSGNGPYLSLACHWLQSRRHRALLGLRGSLLAEWNAASERHAMLAKDQPTCYLSSPQTAVPTVVCSLWSVSFAAGQCQWVKWFDWKRLSMRQWPSFIIWYHLSSFVHSHCMPKWDGQKVRRSPGDPCVFVYDARSDNHWVVGISSISPTYYITLHYTTLHYITLHYITYIHTYMYYIYTYHYHHINTISLA